MSNAVEMKNLCFSYSGEETLRGVTAVLKEQKLHALFGPNGSGKSTLLRCLAGLLRPDAGSLMLLGQDSAALSPKKRSQLLAYVPQEHRVSFPFTVEEVVLTGRTPHLNGIAGPAERDCQAVKAALDALDITALAQQPYTELSGGQRQLTIIARALAQETPVIVLDEPTSALDFRNQLRIWEVLRSLCAGGKTVIVCTHDPNHVLWFCDRVLVLETGRAAAQGEPKDILTAERLTALYGFACTLENGAVRPRVR